MKRSNRLVLLIGIFLAVIAFVGIAVFLQPGGGTPTPTAPTELPTVIATKDVPLGAVVTTDMVTTKQVKVDERKVGAFSNTGLVIGQKARRPIKLDAQLEALDFTVSSGTTEIDVPKGFLGLAVQVDQLTGVGTILKNGDYVDMIVSVSGASFPVVTVNPDDESITVVAGLNSTSVKLLLQGMQVIGRFLPPPPAAAQGAPAASGEPVTNLSGQQEIVVLAVTPQQAEVIKFAQETPEGSITLALRSTEDFFDAQGNPVVTLPAGTTGVILKTLVDSWGVLRPELVEAILPAQ